MGQRPFSRIAQRTLVVCLCTPSNAKQAASIPAHAYGSQARKAAGEMANASPSLTPGLRPASRAESVSSTRHCSILSPRAPGLQQQAQPAAPLMCAGLDGGKAIEKAMVKPCFPAQALHARAADGSGFWESAPAPDARHTATYTGRPGRWRHRAPCVAGRRRRTCAIPLECRR